MMLKPYKVTCDLLLEQDKRSNWFSRSIRVSHSSAITASFHHSLIFRRPLVPSGASIGVLAAKNSYNSLSNLSEQVSQINADPHKLDRLPIPSTVLWMPRKRVYTDVRFLAILIDGLGLITALHHPFKPGSFGAGLIRKATLYLKALWMINNGLRTS